MTLEAYVQGFGCLQKPTPYSEAKIVVLPIPLEICPSEAPGAALGPLAILGASRFIETFDAELGFDPLDRVATLDGAALTGATEEAVIAQVEDHVRAVYADGKTPLCLGGERVLALPTARATRKEQGEIGVVVLSRRPGFLDTAAGRLLTTETIGRRLVESFPVVFFGQRYWSAAEAEYLHETKDISLVAASSLCQVSRSAAERTSKLPEKVHLSIDVGVLQPALMPIAGNFEPGGLGWYALIDIVAEVFRQHDVVSCDISGFAPTIGQVAPGLVVAQLVLRCLALMARS